MFNRNDQSFPRSYFAEKGLFLALGLMLTLLLGALTATHGVSEPISIAFWLSLAFFSYRAAAWSSDGLS